MTPLVATVFVLTYLGMALGRLPGLALDRSGIAAVAAIVLVASGAIATERVAAAIHFPTLILLFSLMIVSARFAAAGFYDWAAARIAAAAGSPTRLLALTIAVGGGLSAVLVNDVVVFVMTPLLVRGLSARGLDPRPFLAALAGAANAGSAATLIGNPQNIVIGQVGGLEFWRFVVVCAPPALVALAIVFLAVRWRWAEALARSAAGPAPAMPDFDRGQSAKAAAATSALLALFATPIPREISEGVNQLALPNLGMSHIKHLRPSDRQKSRLIHKFSALAIAGVLLLSRRFASRDMLTAVDWPLLLLFTGLFVINDALAATGVTAQALAWLASHGLMPDRLAVMLPGAVLASNTVGNVPAVILLLAVWPQAASGVLYGLALTTTLAGNFFLVGSIANLIVAERAAREGVRFGFRDHARAGVPMTLASLLVAACWLLLGGWMGW